MPKFTRAEVRLPGLYEFVYRAIAIKYDDDTNDAVDGDMFHLSIIDWILNIKLRN